MNFAGIEVVDLRRPNEDWGRKSEVIGTAFHHSVSDLDTSPLNDLQACEQIRQYHESLGWAGCGYEWIVGDDGTGYYMGDIEYAHAHVWGRNHELNGVCFLGNYMECEPPQAQIEGGARIHVAIERRRGSPLPFGPHFGWALPQAPTACPGATWEAWKPRLSEAIVRERNKMDEEARKSIDVLKACLHLASLGITGKWQELANALKWLGVQAQ